MIKLRVKKQLHLASGTEVLHIDVELPAGKLSALYGPSGAGKTSLLNIIAGLMQPEDGYIEVNGKVWLDTDSNISLAPQERNVGFMFQDYALFPNMTVAENLFFASPKGKQAGLQVDEILAVMQLQNLKEIKPNRLSGGQQQRVALARAIMRQPEVLLLDEPLSALDHNMRHELREVIAEMHQTDRFTTLMVSHELNEIYHLASHVLHIEEGKIIAQGTPSQLFGTTHTNKLKLTGEVLRLNLAHAEIAVNNQVITVPLNLNQGGDFTVGEKVTLLCDAANLTIQKLS